MYTTPSLPLPPPPYQESLPLCVNPHGEVNIDSGQYSIYKVHDPHHTLVVEGGMEGVTVDVDIGSGNWRWGGKEGRGCKYLLFMYSPKNLFP